MTGCAGDSVGDAATPRDGETIRGPTLEAKGAASREVLRGKSPHTPHAVGVRTIRDATALALNDVAATP